MNSSLMMHCYEIYENIFVMKNMKFCSMAISKLGAYNCVIFPLSSMELQQLLQLEAILYVLRR